MRARNTKKYELGTDDVWTVYAIDQNGEYWDLNAEGEEILSLEDLENFVHELFEQGFFDREVRNSLLSAIDDEDKSVDWYLGQCPRK